jgi:hypothetical protein
VRTRHAYEVDVDDAVLQAARARAAALATGDEVALTRLLHPAFVWTSHTGELFDRDRYIGANLDGPTVWRSQNLDHVTFARDAGAVVLRCIVTDEVTVNGQRTVHRMPCTQTWVWMDARWQLLAGHAGPMLLPGPSLRPDADADA